MSPFAECFHKIRLQRGIRQKDLANLMGYEQAYLSAVELDIKGPPPEAFIQKLQEVLILSDIEYQNLLDAAEASQRKFTISGDLHPDIFWMMRDMRKNLSTLSIVQIQLIRQILGIKEALKDYPVIEPRQIRRRKINQEVAM